MYELVHCLPALVHQILNLLDSNVKSNEIYRKLKWFLGFCRIDRVISDDIP